MLLGALAARPAAAFDFNDVAREADRVARAPYRQPAAADPALAGLSYDAYRKQRFRPDQSTWRGGGTPFELQFFPLGRTFTRPLTLFEVVGDEVRPLRVPASAFEGGAPAGAAGVRVHRWVDQPRRQSDETGGVPGRQLLPHGRPGSVVRPVRARPGDRHRGRCGRRIPGVHDLLVPPAATR